MNSTAITSKTRHTLPVSAVAILFVTAVVSLVWSHYKLLSQDEIFVLQTDSVSSVRQLVHIQRTTPISLDPLAYHLLTHAATKVFGATAFALRLPSLAGFLLMQVCLFVLVRRRAGGRAALFAMAFPALTATLFYSAEARPYGMLLGLSALMLVCWRRATDEARPVSALVLLALTITVALNTHYFAILLLIPLCAAELARTMQRRRLDVGVAGAIAGGVAGIVFTMPFQKAAAEFRTHYYNGGAVSVRAITQGYRALFVDYTHYSMAVQRSMAFAFVCLAVMFAVACVRLLQRRMLPFADAVFVVVLTLLPFFGFVLARFVTHSFEVRYVLGALIGVSVLLALALRDVLARPSLTLLTVMLCGAVGVGGWVRITDEMRTSRTIMDGLVVPDAVKAAVLASPTGRLYVQDMGHFDVASLYEPDVEMRARLALVYSRENEIRYDGHDTVSLTAMHMRAFTPYAIVEYRDWKKVPGPVVLLQFQSGWNWTGQALAADGVSVRPLGRMGEGEAVSVSFARR